MTDEGLMRASEGSVEAQLTAYERYCASLKAHRDGVRQRYAHFIGQPYLELPTPALLLDLPTVRKNIATMASRMRGRPAIRPHVKVHKSPDIARLQMGAGAVGVTCATVAEALSMANAGLEDILIANEVLDPGKLRVLAEAARLCRITVAVDSAAGAEALSAAAIHAGVDIGAVVEVDTGMGRGGVRTAEEATQVGVHAAGLAGITVRGVTGWEGHVLDSGQNEHVAHS